MARAAQAYLAYTHTVMYATTWKRLSPAPHRGARTPRRLVVHRRRSEWRLREGSTTRMPCDARFCDALTAFSHTRPGVRAGAPPTRLINSTKNDMLCYVYSSAYAYFGGRFRSFLVGIHTV